MVAVEPLKGPLSTSMTCLDNPKLNTKSVHISLPNIMPYMPLADSST